ncbi:MAG: DUF3473 domain-containing protein [Proteobacteria bacterium]|nr:DUF3473 domain-containing protein [Desulfobulbaceae bacterium]MBU4153657.1 DUF3473 domain-containing protein [Pseudomonadota bacterium]
MINYLTIDVEDYYQVSAFDDVVDPAAWDGMPSRVERNTQVILDILDGHQVKATFFIVGWIAERYPALVQSIVDRGHDIGCHSYRHRRIYTLTPQEFREDTKKAKDILEAISGREVVSYRAPSYSITRKSLWALDILEELGFKYDSSIFPIRHDIYGIPDAPRFKYKLPDHEMIEFPISTAKVFGRNIPAAGGGYFRLFPYWLTKILLTKINRDEQQPFVFYLHPWEVDPGQPRIHAAKPLSKFRHYNNLNKTAIRFDRLLCDFLFAPLACC